MDLRIGTAGYSYQDWIGSFYPRGTTDRDMLAYYARHFPAVEVNRSFYRPLTLPQIEKMAGRVPAGFGFTLKAPKTVSHERDPADLPAFKASADRLAALGKLLGLMVQVPEAFHDTVDNRDWLNQIADALRPHTTAVEFRHRSWSTPGLTEWAAAVGLDVVSVGVPDLPTLFPAGPQVANRRVYVRLHSQNADNWYKGGSDRYDYDYPEPVIRKWANALKALAEAGRVDSSMFFFTNCVSSQAVANARKLAEVLKATAPSVRVIDPPAPAGHQPGLFNE